jgi:hypothetical protein
MNRINFHWRTGLLAALLAVATFGAVRFLFSSFFSPSIRMAGLVIGLPLGALLGGYWAGQQRATFAWLYGLFAVGLEILAAFLLRAVPGSPIPIVLALAFGPLAAEVSARGGIRGLNLGGRLPGREERLYQTLLMRVRQDRYTAERLIDFERRRAPNAPRARLIADAIERIDRDRR